MNEGGLIRLDTALTEQIGNRGAYKAAIWAASFFSDNCFQQVSYSVQASPKVVWQTIELMLPNSVYFSLSPFQASHLLTFLSSPLISQNDSWDPRLSWLSDIAPNMLHGNVLEPRNPHTKQPVWKHYCIYCVPEEFLDYLADTSIKSSTTHEASFLNPTFPLGFISIWGFSPSSSVSYDFHAEGFHGLFPQKAEQTNQSSHTE